MRQWWREWGSWIIFAACLFVYAGGTAYLLIGDALHRHDKKKTDVMLKGRADKENGLGINTNPYIYPDERELWLKGWREASVVRE